MLDERGMAKMTALCQDQEWRVELIFFFFFFTHMLAERCCWEPGRLTMAVECPGEAGAG